jgi:hypothetical protein
MPSTRRFIYERRIVGFIDILGLSDHLLGSGGSKFAENVVAIISEALDTNVKTHVILRHIKSKNKVEVYFPGWHFEPDICRISSISDSIVVSIPEFVVRNEKKESPLFPIVVCLEMAFHLQRLLLQLGILTRGCISYGRLHHANNIVIGDGLVSAYRLENQLAIFPRVILAPPLQQLMLAAAKKKEKSLLHERIASLFSQDYDGMYFVDYLGIDLVGIERDWAKRLRLIEAFVRRELQEIKDLRIKQKFHWLQNYIHRAKGYIQTDSEWSPHSTTGKLETAFPRVWPAYIKAR